MLSGAALALLMLVAGCVSIPGDGPIVVGRELGQPGVPRVQVYPRDPAAGASPVEIVQGFLAAAPDFAVDHRVARLFLSDDARATWRPDDPVVIYRDQGALSVQQVDDDGQPIPAPNPNPTPTPRSSSSPSGSAASPSSSPVSGAAASPSSSRPPVERGDVPISRPRDGERATVQVRVPVVARIEQGGVYRVSESSDEEIKVYHLIAVDGQWRILDPADGVVISEADFRYTFGPVPLYFPDTGTQWLVPDLRWFPLTSAPTVVVDALLAGPTPWLRGAVTSAAPLGTQLTANGVRVDGEVLTVDLTKRALDASPRARRVLYAQLRATIDEAAQQFEFRAGELRVTVEQATFEVPSTGDPEPLIADSVTVDTRPVVLSADHRLARLDDDLSVLPVADLEHLPTAASTHPAVSPSGQVFAVLEGSRTRLITATAKTARNLVAVGRRLTAPSFDRYDWVWTAEAASPGWVVAGQDDRIARVSASWLGGYQVSSLRISREGARALIVASHNGRTSAFVSGVVRGDDGAPVALTVPMALVPDLATGVDAAWVDARSVVVLGARTGSPKEQPWLVQLGGDITATVVVAGGQSITAGATAYELWVQTPKGVLTRAGGTFLPIAGVSWPAVAG